MPKDKRLYMTFPIDFDEHPKVEPLSDAAFRVFVAMNGYSRRQKLDGRIPLVVARKKWRVRALAELVASHPKRPLVLIDGDVYVLREYAEHQFTTDDEAALHAERSAAGSKGGKASATAKANRKQLLDQTGSKKEAGSRSGLNLQDLRRSSSVIEIRPGTDIDRIAVELERVVGRECARLEVLTVIWDIENRAEKAGTIMRSPTAYVLDSIRDEPEKWRELLGAGTTSGPLTDPVCVHHLPPRQCPECREQGTA